MKSYKLLWLITVSLLLFSNCSNERNEIRIYTVPDNLNIYFARLDTNRINLAHLDEGQVQVKLNGYWVQIYNKKFNNFFLIEKKYRAGKSPVVVRNVNKGSYLIGVEPIEFLRGSQASYVSQNIDPFLKPVAAVAAFPFENIEMREKWRLGEIQLGGSIVYLFEKAEDRKGIIIIYCKENISLDELKNIYPTDVNFKFNDQKLMQELDARNIDFTEAERQTIFNLLSRGGIIIIKKGDIRFLIKILNEEQFIIQTQAYIKG